MDIGLWNIDHPETGSGKKKDEQRYHDVLEYLVRADCDAYIITEANAAMDLPGYSMEMSEVSPFRSSRRFYGEPNCYYQVAIYSKLPMKAVKVDEPVNGLCCQLPETSPVRTIYGNVITIKDQWSKTSSKSYADRLEEQIQAIHALPSEGTLVGGDFNLRVGWKQKQSAYLRLQDELASTQWAWPTEYRDDTVQHVLHSPGLEVQISFDFDVKYKPSTRDGLSDHPFFRITL
jgi:hypothetical protein